MNTAILIIAHTPLASALRDCAGHVFPDRLNDVYALDVDPDMSPEITLELARAIQIRSGAEQTLLMSDICGATPCNVAQKLINGRSIKLVTGVNLPMLLRAVCYSCEPIDTLVSRALAGGTQGIMTMAATAPQEQKKFAHAQEHRDHQQ
jgi:PTS system mannose-specific IIA component